MSIVTNNISGSVSNSSVIGITGSVIIGNSPAASFPVKRTDTVFFVSGSNTSRSVFGGTVFVSGSLFVATGESAQTIGIGTGNAANVISIGSNAASQVSVNGGDSLNLYADGGTITIDAGGAGSNTINVGTFGYAQTLSVGNTTGATSLTFRAGSGGITFETNATASGDIAVNGGDITTTAATMNLVNAATTINLGSTAIARTTNIATGAASQTVTLGSSNSTSTLTLDAGTGNINIGTSQSARIITIGPDSTNTPSAITHTVNVGYIPTHTSAITNVNIGTAGAGVTKNVIIIGNYGSTVDSTTTIFGDELTLGRSDKKIGFFGATAIVKPVAGAGSGFTQNSGTSMNSASTSTGGTGASSYTFASIVRALKDLGLITS